MARESLGWSQKELAFKARVNRSWLSLLELGEIDDPGVMRMSQLAGALGTCLESLITGNEPSQEVVTVDPEKASIARRILRHTKDNLLQLAAMADAGFSEPEPGQATNPARKPRGRRKKSDGAET